MYGYGDGDPVNNTDPFGLSACCVTSATSAVLGPKIAEAATFASLKANWPEIESMWNEGVRDIGSLMVVAGGIEALATSAPAVAGVSVGTPVYRLSGGGSQPVGRFWSTANPVSTPNFASGAGLPLENSMTTLTRGFVAEATGVRLTRAAPGARGPGGLPEVQALDPKAQIQVQSITPFKPPE